ncbi:MAG TPA: metalloregulator ArsR/SmtB family transcription factor [Bryobacteraceae bacterium]|nr:metalloregulator ArsR/SmtB family transcription factor [Bryobacteraceae bacterium]
MQETVACEQQAKLFAALSDPVRLRFVRELADGDERSGSMIAERLGISLALLCHHSKILVDAGIVVKRKEAQTAYYRANKQILKRALRDLLS